MGFLSQVSPTAHDHIETETGHETFYGTAIAGQDICAYEMGEEDVSSLFYLRAYSLTYDVV
jgi:uncharacterized membrane protein